MPPLKFPSDSEAGKLIRVIATEENALAIKKEIKDFLDKNVPGASQYLPEDPQIADLLREFNRALNLPSPPTPEAGGEHPVPKNYVPVPAEHHSSGDPSLLKGGTQTNLAWLSMPAEGEARQAMNTAVRDAFPGGMLHQDSLSLFLNRPEIQKMFQGNQSTAGSVSLMSKAKTAELLSSLAMKMPSPETTKALSLLQSALPTLMGQEGSGSLEILVGNWFDVQTSANADLPKVFEALIQLLEQSGLSSTEQGQDLLLALFKDLKLVELAADRPQANILQSLGRQIQALALSSVPLVQGLNHFLQGNLFQGLSQLIQPFMRALASLFMMKSETWPKSLPNENTLSKLATIYASQAKKAKEKKERDKRKPKKWQGSFADGEFHPEDFSESQNSEESDEALSALAS